MKTRYGCCLLALGSLLLLFLPSPAGAARQVVAARVDTPPALDGWLREPVWDRTPPTADFVQQRPDTGAPSTATTTVRLLFDDDALYVGFRCDEPDSAGVLGRALGRDSDFADEDYFRLVLDTFDDDLSAFVFTVNPNGARSDRLVRNEGEYQNLDWDGIWSVRTQVTADGWQGEMRVPWRTLRFPRRDALSMGVNFERQRRRVNEQSHWSAVPREFTVYRVGLAGRLEGLRAIDPGRNVVLRPYVLGRASRGTSDDWDTDSEIGLDAKIGLTPSLTLDLTVNTDFAQVEVDDQIVNVTRFEVEFPEKREFFLEKANLFRFGSARNQLFYSRTIGLDARGRTLPIDYGARVTGRVDDTEIGVLAIEQDDARGLPTRRFGVVRLRHDVGTRSSVGLMITHRNSADDGEVDEPDDTAIGIDGDLNPTDRLLVSGYTAVDERRGAGPDAFTWGARARWSHPSYRITALHEAVGSDYDPATGFVNLRSAPGVGVNVYAAGVTHAPEPNLSWVRRFENSVEIYALDRRRGPLEARQMFVGSTLVGPSEERVGFYWRWDFDRLFGPGFGLGPKPDETFDVVFPAGEYHYGFLGFELQTDPSHWWTARVAGVTGEFFDGSRTNVNTRVDVRFAPHVVIGAETVSERIERDAEDGGKRRFNSDLLRFRLGVDLNTSFGLDVFAQYNSEQRLGLSQVRAHWIFGDESDLYLVFNDARDADIVVGTDRFRVDLGDRRRNDWTLKLSYAHQL
jgi:hypothetical protein